MNRPIGDYLRNVQGNLSIVAALCALPVALTAGVAIDYSRISRTETEVQAALDAAVLSAAARGSLDATQAKKAFEMNSKARSDLAVNKLTFTSDGSGVITASAQVTMPLGMMSLAGKTAQVITVSSRAKGTLQTKMSQVQFQITNAQGAYDKEIYFFTKDKDGKVTSETLMLSYDYTLSSNNVASKVFTPATNTAKTVTVGQYDTVGEKMVVYEDNSYRGKKVNPKSYYSDDPKASSWTKTKGKCTDPGGETQNWEDGGDSNYADFVFTLKCTETSSGKRVVRLMN